MTATPIREKETRRSLGLPDEVGEDDARGEGGTAVRIVKS
jgi:hypothetical protein